MAAVVMLGKLLDLMIVSYQFFKILLAVDALVFVQFVVVKLYAELDRS